MPPAADDDAADAADAVPERAHAVADAADAADPGRGRLTVAVTGPTGTFGFGLVPLLQAEPRIAQIAGIARRPFEPADHGWSQMEYRQGDVRDLDALTQAFAGADVVVHLAFMITGNADAATIRAINVDGTLNAFRAAREAGAARFVYASSVAAYGFHPDNPVGITEDWPTRPADRLFYAQEKAELEEALRDEAGVAAGSGGAADGPGGAAAGPGGAAAGPGGAAAGADGAAAGGGGARPNPALYLLRPPIVLGPHAMGAKGALPGPLARAGRLVLGALRASPLPMPVLAPEAPVQFIHEDDVGQALLKCVLGAGPPGAYNIAADGVVTGADIARELGLAPVALPAALLYGAARAAAALPRPPFVPPAADWVEALSHPAIMDTSKAKRELGWEPRYTAVEALRATLRPVAGGPATASPGSPRG